MDDKTAEALLDRIQEEKQAAGIYEQTADLFDSAKGKIKDTFSDYFGGAGGADSKYQGIANEVRDLSRQQLRADATRNVISAMLMGGGAGMALRGLTGMGRTMSPPAKPINSRTVDMPVMYPAPVEEDDKEKAAAAGGGGGGWFDDSQATSAYGLNGYIPGMLLGVPLAAYGGWKGVDALMDTQRRKRTEDDLEQAKQRYQKALLGSYKAASTEESSDEILDGIFETHYEKRAAGGGLLAWLSDKFSNAYPNAKGMTTGLAASYAIPASLGGYLATDAYMKKRSKRKMLEKAMQERARRQAELQPAELYAVPTPKEEPKEV